MKIIKCATLEAIDAISVDVEATFTQGLPTFSIVGLANSTISESKDRVKSALLTNDFRFPPLKITVNLSPSDISKSGSQFDLSIALLIATHNLDVAFEDIYFFGELGLDGSLKDTNSIFISILSLANQGLLKRVLIPTDSIDKINVIPNIEIFAVSNLSQGIDFLSNREKYRVDNQKFQYKYLTINNHKYYYTNNFLFDFKDIKGQKIAKRAAIISASGFHNILLEGSPGCGKSMIAKRIPYIMPPMSIDEILQKAKIEALDSCEVDFVPQRVFRSPHHTATKASIFGGGSKNGKQGEIALSHNGVLFFDELPHFPKNVLEALREPLEDNKLLISRVNTKIEYQTKFLFIGAMNPCPCGNLLAKSKECRCSDIEVMRYKNRLSDPFLDRIDIYVVMNEVNFDDKADVSSAELFQQMLNAFKMQKSRNQTEFNGKLSEADIKKYCILKDDASQILNKAIESYSLSFRAINKVLKVARTIADLELSDDIEKQHIFEALSYRKR